MSIRWGERYHYVILGDGISVYINTEKWGIMGERIFKVFPIFHRFIHRLIKKLTPANLEFAGVCGKIQCFSPLVVIILVGLQNTFLQPAEPRKHVLFRWGHLSAGEGHLPAKDCPQTAPIAE